jgi:hypothetical protein
VKYDWGSNNLFLSFKDDVLIYIPRFFKDSSRAQRFKGLNELRFFSKGLVNISKIAESEIKDCYNNKQGITD